MTVDDLLALAPTGTMESLFELLVPLTAAGFGLVTLFWFMGAFWSIVMSIFEL